MDRNQMNLEDFYHELAETLVETSDEMFARLKKSEVVSLEHYRKAMKQFKDWKPLSLEDYTFELRATQQEKVIKALEDSRKIINDRVKRQNKLTPKK